MLAIRQGTTTPKNATNFLKPLLCEKAFFQTIKTNTFTQSCKQPAITLAPVKIFVKFAIKKNEKPAIPEIVIHFEFLSILFFLPQSIM